MTHFVSRTVAVVLFAACCGGAGYLVHMYVGSSVQPPSPAASSSEVAAAKSLAASIADGTPGDDSQDSDEQRRLRAELRKRFGAVAYVGGYKSAPAHSGVTVHDRSRAFQGLNFYTAGHAQEAYLMDMDGQIVHTWRRDAAESASEQNGEDERPQSWWRRAYLYPDGSLLAIRENVSLAKYDKHSNEIWKLEGQYHHDLQVLQDGRIFVLTKQKQRRPYLRKHKEADDDRITVLDADGQLLGEVSILDAFENSEYSGVPTRSIAVTDVLHTNTIEVLDGRLASKSDAFKSGNVLISCLSIDTIAIVDMQQESVVWALSGMWRMQHQPTVLDNGNILLFDNRGQAGSAKVIEFDPFTQRLVWSYKGPTADGWWSRQLGSNQRLPNGNTLITDSVNGRAFEVTRRGEMVWEYVNPGRSGESDEFIAVICEMIRLDPEFPLDWIPGPRN